MMESSSINQHPRLCFVGPMVGRNPGYVTTQGQILSDLFLNAGHSVISVSALLNRYGRLIDIASTIIRQQRSMDVMVLDVFGGPSFVVEDVASRLGRSLGKRIVMCLRGGAMPEFMARHPRWTRQVLGRADMLVAPSEYLARAVNPYGFRARVIPNVIDLDAYVYRRREKVGPRLFWMRSFHPIWNPAMAVRVLARLRATHPDATLVMAGQDKGSMQQVQRLADDLGVGGSVKLAGFLNMEGKKREAGLADIYINTNRIDNMPVAVVEACAMGMPVVATAVGGIPDLLRHGETALFVPDDDDEAMAQAVRSLLDNSELAERLSVNGRKLAERFSWKQVRLEWEQVFADVMNRSYSERMGDL